LARDPVERLADEREEVEREEVERAEVEREELEREPPARDPLERDAVARLVVREPLLRVEPEPELVPRDERDDDAFDCARAVPALPKSLSACLLVFAALRRSALSAAVTSL